MTTPQRVPQLDDVLADLLTRRQSLDRLRRLTTVPAGVTDFSSNAYLSLSSHPEVQRAFLARLESSVIGGSSGLGILGSGGSRLLDGNSALAESLEGRIAAFHRAPAGLLFNSAMDANVGLFSCVPQPGDVVVYDELIHASVHDGMRLSRAGRRVPFAHNCVYAGPARSRDQQTAVAKELMGLEAVLRGFQEGADGTRNVFVVVEGLYSMDGDVAPLKDIVECVERCLPRGNGYIIVDEAHSTGIFGDRGRGLVSELGLEDRVWARVLGFGKAMGCAGGIVLCSAITRSYLINYARTLIYTTSMPFTSLAGIEVTYNFLTSGRAEPLVIHLRSVIQHAHKLFVSICLRQRPPAHLFRLLDGEPESPVIPLLTAHPRSLAQHCQRRGFMVRPIVAPTVPIGRERVRVCLHAGNTIEEVEGLALVLEEWVAEWKAKEEAEAGERHGAAAPVIGTIEKPRL